MPPGWDDRAAQLDTRGFHRAVSALALRAERPELAVLVLSEYVEERYAGDLLASSHGGVGYLLKDRIADVADFVDALRRVYAGGTALDPEVVAQLLIRRRSDPLEQLTPRETRRSV